MEKINSKEIIYSSESSKEFLDEERKKHIAEAIELINSGNSFIAISVKNGDSIIKCHMVSHDLPGGLNAAEKLKSHLIEKALQIILGGNIND